MSDIMEKLREKYKEKKVLIVGLGLQGGGVASAIFFVQLGAHVCVTDKKTPLELESSVEKLNDYKITYRLGGHNIEDFLQADLIIKGPSVPWNLPELVTASEKGVPIDMEASFFAQHSPATLLAISGTRGKSTTTQMIYQILKKGLSGTGKRIFLGGNIPEHTLISYLSDSGKDDIVVAELSSWQLSGFHYKKISPHISIFTNFYPDHLNYYATMEEYFFDKTALFLYQNEHDILVAQEDLKSVILNLNPKGEVSFFSEKTYQGKLSLIGVHNRENASAAYVIAKLFHLEEYAEEIFSTFKGLSGREEYIDTINGIAVINDTTSTTPVACIKAIQAFHDKPIILILGGNSKNLPVEDLISYVKKTKRIILLKGSLTDQIITNLDPQFYSGPYDNLEEAIQSAFISAENGDVILFSPGATSFAQFKNEFDRGDQFVNGIRLYESKNT